MGTAAPVAAQTIYATTSTDRLIRFQGMMPHALELDVAITGLEGGDHLIGIEFRPATGQLVGVAGSARLYIINPANGQARPLRGAAPIALDGTSFGVDINPVTDRLRIVSNTEQNLRISPDTGALAGMDTALAPAGAITAIAHSNAYADADLTTLYGIDAVSDELVRIGGSNGNPTPNGGTVTPIGPLGVDTSEQAAFDIFNAGSAEHAYASLTVGGQARLYSINLNTGAATLRGQIGLAPIIITGMAVQAPVTVTIYAVTDANTLIAFSSRHPERQLYAVGIAGLRDGETLVGLDTRPATGQLYALGSLGQLYTIDPVSGQALTVGAPIAATLNGSDIGFDFNPVADRIRVVTNADQNLRLHPGTGELVAIDTPINPASPALIGGVAYTNNRSGATATTLYGIDPALDRLVRIGGTDGVPSPNGGTITAIGGLLQDTTAVLGFDIAAIDNTGYAALVVSGGVPALAQVDLGTGRITVINEIDTPGTIRGMTVASPGKVEFSAPVYFATENGFSTHLVLRRSSAVGTAEVEVRNVGGSATPDVDYGSVSRLIIMAPGITEYPIAVPVFVDALNESDETAGFQVSDAGLGSLIGERSLASLYITDNNFPLGPTINITSPSADPTLHVTSALVRLGGTAADASGVTGVRWFNARGPFGTATGTTDWFANVALLPGKNDITVLVTNSSGQSSTALVYLYLDEAKYTLAEGATGGFFDLDLLIANPTPTTVPASLEFLKEDGTTLTQLRLLPPLSRTTIRVDDIAGLDHGAVSTIVTSTNGQPLLVERTMRWDPSGYGAHGEKATDGPALTWYFAEGAQGFFDTFLLFTNPSGGANTAHVKFLMESGAAVTQDFPMLGSSRLSVPLNSIPLLHGQAFGIVVTFDAPAVAERAMYFGTPLYNGGHDSVGETALSTDWFLAEGATGGFFTTFVLIANPGASDANLTLTYLPEGGTPVVKETTLAAGKRLTINVASEDPSLAATAVATRVQSTVPIVAERAQYWPGAASDWYEAHNSFGVTALGTKWGLAEGRAGGTGAAQTFILLANPGNSDATVTLQLLREPGRSPQTVTLNVTVPKQSRKTITPADLQPALQNETFGALITSTQPIAVERALYFDANGQTWAAGTNATATRLP